MNFLTCLPLIEADIPAVLSLDQRCLGGLWTRSGYLRELESPQSDLLVLVATPSCDLVRSESLQPPAVLQRPGASCPDALKGSAISATASLLILLGVGCLWAILDEAHITTLAIEPAFQGCKLGQLLLAHLLHCGYQRGLTHATLEVRASNCPALGLYQKFGFKEAGLRKRYYSDGEDARILWCSGLQKSQTQALTLELRQSAIAHIESRPLILGSSVGAKVCAA